MIYVWPGDQGEESVLAKCVLQSRSVTVVRGMGPRFSRSTRWPLLPSFPGIDTAYQFNYPSVTRGPNLEFQTSVL